MRTPNRSEIYELASRWVRDVLPNGDSLFTPGAKVWSDASVDAVFEHFVDNPDEGAGDFLSKLQKQLTGAPDLAKQAMAELLTIHLMIATWSQPAGDDRWSEQKQFIVRSVLGWMRQPADLPADAVAALHRGIASPGMGMQLYRWRHLIFLLRFVRLWKGASSEQRQRWLDDADEFRALLHSISVKAAQTQREALLHLVHPDAFEPITSRKVKRAIARTFHEFADPDADIDEQLRQIRTALAPEHGEGFSFYDADIREMWDPDEEAVENVAQPAGELPRQAWLVRAGRGGSLVEDWLNHSFASVGWDEIGAVPDYKRTTVIKAMQEAYPDQAPGWHRQSAGSVHRFVAMGEGDLVVTNRGPEFWVGVIAGPARYAKEASSHRLRRSIEWLNPDEPFQREDLSEGARSVARSISTIVDFSAHVGELLALAGGVDDPALAPELNASSGPTPLPRPSRELARELLLDHAWLTDVVDMLEEKRQIVLYGPPGTGKTFLARRLANELGAEGTSMIVQFHPSYGYEDFVEGFRPQLVEEGGMRIELVQGPLRRMAESARENPEQPHVLIIDELNRANIAKVFGELYFLLEYRNERISLQYSPETEFQLPSNLFIVGTMNTADRSIALLDAALRRRFYFVPLDPLQAPIDGLLERWLEREGMDRHPADLLRQLNARIGDSDFAIGPSYLMSHRAGTRGGLERIWERAILPLLTEHYYGTGRDVSAEFGLARLERDLEASAAPLVGVAGRTDDAD